MRINVEFKEENLLMSVGFKETLYLKGDKGDKGDKGEQGERGTDGYTPVKGIDYFDGEKGDKGDKGEQGEQGIQGIQGIQGVQGIQGEKGEQGEDGNGIASTVLNADYTLTITFTDGTSYTTPSIRGAQGADGEKGEQGERGADGLTTSVTVNGETIEQVDGNIDIGTVIRQHQSLSGYATELWVNAQGFIKSLVGYATEAWVEAKGYLTEHQSLAEYRKSSAQDVIDNGKVDKENGKGLSENDYSDSEKAKVASAVQPSDISDMATKTWVNGQGYSTFSGSYNDLSDKPTIPSALSQLSADATHRLVTDTEKSTWNGKESTSNKVTSVSASSTDTQYPTAKCLYDIVGNIEALLAEV